VAQEHVTNRSTDKERFEAGIPQAENYTDCPIKYRPAEFKFVHNGFFPLSFST
jgi:hypothetical protein